MKNWIVTLTLACTVLVSVQVYSQEQKYIGAITKESDVPEYELPDLFTSFEGKKIKSVRQWERIRRPEIMKFFAENMYGTIPTPPDPVKKSFTLVSEDKEFIRALYPKRGEGDLLQQQGFTGYACGSFCSQPFGGSIPGHLSLPS